GSRSGSVPSSGRFRPATWSGSVTRLRSRSSPTNPASTSATPPSPAIPAYFSRRRNSSSGTTRGGSCSDTRGGALSTSRRWRALALGEPLRDPGAGRPAVLRLHLAGRLQVLAELDDRGEGRVGRDRPRVDRQVLFERYGLRPQGHELRVAVELLVDRRVGDGDL